MTADESEVYASEDELGLVSGLWQRPLPQRSTGAIPAGCLCQMLRESCGVDSHLLQKPDDAGFTGGHWSAARLFAELFAQVIIAP